MRAHSRRDWDVSPNHVPTYVRSTTGAAGASGGRGTTGATGPTFATGTAASLAQLAQLVRTCYSRTYVQRTQLAHWHACDALQGPASLTQATRPRVFPAWMNCRKGEPRCNKTLYVQQEIQAPLADSARGREPCDTYVIATTSASGSRRSRCRSKAAKNGDPQTTSHSLQTGAGV